MNSPSNDQWELSLDIDNSDIRLTSRIPEPAGIVQAAKLRKQADIQECGDESVMSTQEYIKKVVEDVGEDEDFRAGRGLTKPDQVVAIIKSCASNVLGDLTTTLKDISDTISVPENDSGVGRGGVGGNGRVGGSRMLKEEEIIKFLKEEEIAEEE
ncbi:hypothetical protein Tco_1210397 [Tanacetum coccineum]